jgi:hypothetical protein
MLDDLCQQNPELPNLYDDALTSSNHNNDNYSRLDPIENRSPVMNTSYNNPQLTTKEIYTTRKESNSSPTTSTNKTIVKEGDLTVKKGKVMFIVRKDLFHIHHFRFFGFITSNKK